VAISAAAYLPELVKITLLRVALAYVTSSCTAPIILLVELLFTFYFGIEGEERAIVGVTVSDPFTVTSSTLNVPVVPEAAPPPKSHHVVP